MPFKFFSKSRSSYIAPPGIAPGLHSKPATHTSLDMPESGALATELDTLSIFLPEDNSSMSARARARVTENFGAASQYASAVGVQDTRAASQIDAKRLDDFRKLLRQTQQTVEQLKGDARAIRDDLSELRSLGDHLGQGYTRLGDICRLTEKRSELTVDVLDAIEKRIEPLEVVRDLRTTEDRFASLKELAEEVKQCGARFEAQKEAIDRAREEATRVARLMDELQARVPLLTEKSEWLGEAKATVGRLEQRATATMAELERRLGGFDGRKRAIEQALATALTEGDQRLAQAQETVRRLEHQGVETAAQLQRRVTDFEARKQTIEQALVVALTVGDQRLEHTGATVVQLEQRAAAAMDQLERRIDNFDSQKSTIERAADEETPVTAVLSVLEGGVALTRSDRALGQAETAVSQLERRTADARVQVEQVRSAGTSRSTSRKIKIRRPDLRWAAILGVLVAVNLLGIVMLLISPDQPNRIASNAPAARQESPAPVSLLPSTASRLAMFDMPAGRAAATTGTIAAREVSSADRRDPPRAAPTAPADGASQVGGSKEPVQYVGALTVDSEPAGSEVFVDRQLVGETPLELTGLRAGSHAVRIERDGYDRWTTAVLVAADKETRVSARLQSLRDR